MSVGRQEDNIQECECGAMRLLYQSEKYTQSLLAMMFECREETVAEHVNRECKHEMTARNTSVPDYSYKDLITAFNEVHERCEYPRMSQQEYHKLKDKHHPSVSTIINRFGCWTEARKQARG